MVNGPGHLECKLEPLEAANVITVRGELDLSNVHVLQDLCDRPTEGRRPLIIDLSEVSYIDGTGLAVLMRTHERYQRRGIEFAVTFTSKLIQRIFSVFSLQDRIHIFPTVSAAMKNLAHGASGF